MKFLFFYVLISLLQLKEFFMNTKQRFSLRKYKIGAVS
ncbi:YSIRK-type signal peptide-containing protein, partial [Streptococcus pyogenes]